MKFNIHSVVASFYYNYEKFGENIERQSLDKFSELISYITSSKSTTVELERKTFGRCI